MVTLSVSAVSAYGHLEKQWALEKENAHLKELLRRQALDADLARSTTERELEVQISEARLAHRDAVTRMSVLERQTSRMARQLAAQGRLLDRTEDELHIARARADDSDERRRAALSLADAAESYALDLDAELSRAIEQRDIYARETRDLRDLASRHMPSIAPAKARTDLDLLREDLIRAKRDDSDEREYLIGMACSGLRTFEASASGYSCNLGQALLQEARALRQDPVCVSFESGGTPRNLALR